MKNESVQIVAPGNTNLDTTEYFHLNNDLNKHLKQFASSFESLIQNFKNDPSHYNNNKVRQINRAFFILSNFL
jgi:hypothetical protein